MVVTNGTQEDNMTPKAFHDAYIDFATTCQANTGVPSLSTLAQAALESAWGTNAPGNNFFGIKAGAEWHGDTQQLHTHEVINGQRIAVLAPFRKYDTPAAGFIDHGLFLKKNHRYANAFKYTDPFQFLSEVAKAGYATDPDYAAKLGKILHLLTS